MTDKVTLECKHRLRFTVAVPYKNDIIWCRYCQKESKVIYSPNAPQLYRARCLARACTYRPKGVEAENIRFLIRDVKNHVQIRDHEMKILDARDARVVLCRVSMSNVLGAEQKILKLFGEMVEPVPLTHATMHLERYTE